MTRPSKQNATNTTTTTASTAGMDLWDVSATARFLGVCEATARRLFYKGKLPGVKIGVLVRFRPEDVRAFVESAVNGKAV